ncbi:MAG: hypothetical protein ACYTDY_17890, partial [Planctomycetota bacterium]
MVKSKVNAKAEQDQDDGKATRAAPEPEAKKPIASTPGDRHTVPEPDPTGEFPNGPAYFLNRELTWLNFNFRVLHEAEDARTPLLERIKFVSIVGSNIDDGDDDGDELDPLEQGRLHRRLQHRRVRDEADRRSEA